jgi:hypothetical protein
MPRSWSPKVQRGFIKWSAVRSWRVTNNRSSTAPTTRVGWLLYIEFDAGKPHSDLIGVGRKLHGDPRMFREMSQAVTPYLRHVNPSFVSGSRSPPRRSDDAVRR